MSEAWSINRLLLSPCPSPRDLERLQREGLALVVNLEASCREYYEEAARLGIPVLERPMRPLSAIPVEELNEAVRTIVKALESGGLVLIHAGSLVDDRCVMMAKAVAAARGGRTPSGIQSLVQELAVSWYRRLLELVEIEDVHRVYAVGKRYEFGAGLEHASTVANVSLDLAAALEERLGLGERELRAAYVAGLLHDVGRFYSERGHEEIGVRILRAHSEDLRGVVDLKLASFCVKHHRRHTNPMDDPLLKEVGDAGLRLAAVVRLADSFTSVYGREEYWGVHLEGNELVVTARFINKRRFNEKGRLLEKVAGVRPMLRSS